MKKKRGWDMYIKYDRSLRNHNHNNDSKLFKAFVVVLMAIGFGLASFYAIKLQMNLQQSQIQNDNGLSGDSTAFEGDTEADKTAILSSGEEYASDATQEKPVDDNQMDVSGSGIKQTVEKDSRIPVKVKGIYVTAKTAGSAKLNDIVTLTETTELNALVIDVKDDFGRITYAMDSPLVNAISAVKVDIKNIETLIKSLKEKNIYLIARIVAFKDPYLAEHRKDLAIKNRDGSLYKDNKGDYWVNPYRQEVWEYLVEVASQAAAIGFDEIQFDYIRFSTGKGISQADFGMEAEGKSKEQIILEFTKYAYENLKPLGVFVSADVYGAIINSKIDAGLVGQDYAEMARYLDYLCPMIYPSHFGEGNYGIANPDLEPYNIIFKALTASRNKLEELPEDEHRAVVRPWLQDFTASWLKKYQVYRGKEVREQIDGVYSAGYEEWLLWNAASRYSIDGLLKE